MDGLWSRMMMMIGCAINLICIYRIMRLIRGDKAVVGAVSVCSFAFHALRWHWLKQCFHARSILYLSRSDYVGWHLRFAFCLGVDQVFDTTGLWFAGFSELLRVYVLSLSPDRRYRSFMAMCSFVPILIWRTIAKPETGHALSPSVQLPAHCDTRSSPLSPSY